MRPENSKKSKKYIPIYKPYLIKIIGRLKDKQKVEIIFTPEDFKEWIYKMIEEGLTNVALFSKNEKKN